MIKQISFKNYKAFENAKLKIKPITILLGANSVGKSSLIQFLLLLEQTVQAEQRNYKSALKLNGSYISLGESKNLFRKFDETKPIEFEMKFNSDKLTQLIKNVLLKEITDGVLSTLSMISKSNEIPDLANSLFLKLNTYNTRNSNRIRLNSKIQYNITKDSFESLIEASAKLIKEKNIPLSRLKQIVHEESFFTRNYFEYIVHNTTKKSIINVYNFLSDLKEHVSNDYTIKYSISSSKNILSIINFSLYTNQKLIFKIDINNDNYNYESNFLNFDNLNKKNVESLSLIFNNHATIFGFVKKYNRYEHKGIVANVFSKIINTGLNEISESFKPDNVHYVSPLRANPKRYYFLDKANANLSIDTFDGDSIAELLNENEDLVDRINRWLKNFGFSISVNPVQDIIHKLTVTQNGLELDITDVGFGISQVLPVIIQGFLSRKDSLTIIEQPEIHLHPKMQADIADLFIEITTSLNQESYFKNDKLIEAEYDIEKYLIIETHSEYLLKRLRRRIAEGRISSNDIAIYTLEFSDEKSTSVLTENIIKKRGFFQWPENFYGDELFLDMKTFMEYQKY